MLIYQQMKNIIYGLFVGAGIFPMVCMGLEINGNLQFNSNEVINDDIYINESVTIDNYGILNGTIHTNGFGINFTNYGQINSLFDISGNSEIIQYITGLDNAHKIYNLYGYKVNVNTTDILNMADFLDLISGASVVNVEKAGFIIDTNLPENNIAINVTNSTTFYIKGLPSDLSKPLIKGIVGTPFVQKVDIDPMYDVTVDWRGPDLYLLVVRWTDYSEIMPDENLGNYLEDLRDKNPNDKLLNALDRAPDRRTLNDILSKSVRTNPIKLMDAPRTINTFYDSMAIDDIKFGFIARPFYIASDDFRFIGGAANVTGKIAPNTVGTVGLNGGSLKYNGDYDEYSGVLYGGNIGVRYMDDDFYLRAFGTMSYAKFDDINAFDGVRMVQNVNGIGGMGTADAGLVYVVGQEIKLIPFIGARMDYASVLNDTNMDVAARAGLNVNVDTDMDGNKYKFGARVLGQTDGAVYTSIYTDMMSGADGVGGGASFGLLYDDMGLSYKLELNIKFEF